MHNSGSARSPIAKPKNTATSDSLSKEESRNDPFLEELFVTLATVSSTMSKNPEINSTMPPRIMALNRVKPIEGTAEA